MSAHAAERERERERESEREKERERERITDCNPEPFLHIGWEKNFMVNRTTATIFCFQNPGDHAIKLETSNLYLNCLTDLTFHGSRPK